MKKVEAKTSTFFVCHAVPSTPNVSPIGSGEPCSVGDANFGCEGPATATGRRIYSTVTDLARLRGWSTLRPL